MSSAADNNNPYTIATLMLPSRLVGKTVSDLKTPGFTIHSQYPFTNLRAGGSQSG